jgi:hypothetical protein
MKYNIDEQIRQTKSIKVLLLSSQKKSSIRERNPGVIYSLSLGRSRV